MGKVKIAVVSDTHCLSTVALCPNNQIPLPDGGFYSPSKSQQWLYQCWEEFWQRVGEVEADKLYIVSNGEAVECQHHSRTQLITLDPPTQMQILRAGMRHADVVALQDDGRRQPIRFRASGAYWPADMDARQRVEPIGR